MCIVESAAGSSRGGGGGEGGSDVEWTLSLALCSLMHRCCSLPPPPPTRCRSSSPRDSLPTFAPFCEHFILPCSPPQQARRQAQQQSTVCVTWCMMLIVDSKSTRRGTSRNTKCAGHGCHGITQYGCHGRHGLENAKYDYRSTGIPVTPVHSAYPWPVTSVSPPWWL